MFRVSRIRSKDILAVGHHSQDDWETTHRLACIYGQHSHTRTEGWERGSEVVDWVRSQWPQVGQGMVLG